eukprot:3671027-Prymnesium_polylepis.1
MPAPVAGKGGRAQNFKTASVARHGFVHGVRTAIPRRPGVFVILGSRNVPAQATDPQARARPAPVAWQGGGLRT